MSSSDDEGTVQFSIETSNSMLGTYTISDSSPMEITLPNNLIANDESNTDKAVCVRAMDGKSKLTVIAFNDEFSSTDTFQASPSIFLPNRLYEFIVVTSSKIVTVVDPEDVEDDIEEEPAYKAMFMVVTTEDNTAITLTLTVSLNLAGVEDITTDGSSKVTLVAGQPKSFNMNKMQTLYVRSEEDLTGSLVQSSKPVSVFSGHECGNVPASIGLCDLMVEQVPPVATWGKSFLIAPLTGSRDSSSVIRVVSSRENTAISLTCSSDDSKTFQIQPAGGFEEFSISNSQHCGLESNKPVLVAQFSVGSNAEVTNTLGDPFLLVVPPVEQYQSKYTLTTFSTEFAKIYPTLVGKNTINIIVPNEFTEQGVRINNGSVLSEWQDIPCAADGGKVCGRATEMEITASGAYHLTHTDPSARFAAMLYWNVFRGGHGYTGAYGLRPIACMCVYATVCVCLCVFYLYSASGNTYQCKLCSV